MAMTTNAHSHLIPVADLRAAISSLLKQRPHTVPELAEELGYCASSIRTRLDVLEQRGLAHRVSRLISPAGGRLHIWHDGLAPAVEPEPTAERPIPGELPKRFFKSSYPAVGKRDYLVAALFGAPREH